MSNLKSPDTQALDALTGGAFSAPTSGERAARVRDWLATEPAFEQMQEVFRELSARDKGAARLLRERLDEIKRAKGQEAIAAEWAQKAQTLLGQSKLNIADALAWQRDAAKAGAPLSREPLAGLKGQLAERIKGIEDLQVKYTMADGSVADIPALVEDGNYGTLVKEVRVTLTARSEAANLQGGRNGANAPDPKLRGSMTSVTTPRAALFVLSKAANPEWR